MIEVSVSRLGVDRTTNAYVVILREKGGSRVLPIWIGRPEAESIGMQMNQWKSTRPLTHDLCKALVTGLGGTLQRVNITRMENRTYYAEMHIDGPQGTVQIDARPSDSIAIALRMAAPIFAPSSLLTTLDEEDEDTAEQSEQAEIAGGVEAELSPDELKTYLENLRPEDFGRFNP